jgi:hypothetical protein
MTTTPNKLNWKIAATVGTITGVAIGGFAFAAPDNDFRTPADVVLEDIATSTPRLSAPVVVPTTAAQLASAASVSVGPIRAAGEIDSPMSPVSAASAPSPVSPLSPVSAPSPVSPLSPVSRTEPRVTTQPRQPAQPGITRQPRQPGKRRKQLKTGHERPSRSPAMHPPGTFRVRW